MKIDYTINGTYGTLVYSFYYDGEDMTMFINNQTPYVLVDGEEYHITRFALKPV